MAEINPQRNYNYWEPIFEPGIYEFSNWDPSINENVTGIKEVSIDIANYQEYKNLEGFNFEKIDFSGILNGGTTKITFKKCIFDKCSFRNAVFENTKFTECIFSYTTFSLSEFKQCEFRKCTYKEIGISGNTTRFENIYIEPDIFLKNVFLYNNKRVLLEKQTTFL